MAHPLLQAVFVTPEGTALLPIQPDLLRVRPGGICKTRLFRGYDPHRMAHFKMPAVWTGGVRSRARKGTQESQVDGTSDDEILLSRGVWIGVQEALGRGTMTRSAAPRGKSTSAVHFPNIGREFENQT